MNLFIGCSSKNEIDKIYLDEATKIIKEIKSDIDLVFGVSENGIMGLCYREFKNKKRKVIGITNETYAYEFKNVPCDEEYVIYSTLDRTKKIVEFSDMMLFLPGGIGTYAEIFHIYEEIRTYDINKKIVIYNYNNFFDELIKIINKLVEEKFMDASLLKYIKITNNPEDVINLINN